MLNGVGTATDVVAIGARFLGIAMAGGGVFIDGDAVGVVIAGRIGDLQEGGK